MVKSWAWPGEDSRSRVHQPKVAAVLLSEEVVESHSDRWEEGYHFEKPEADSRFEKHLQERRHSILFPRLVEFRQNLSVGRLHCRARHFEMQPLVARQVETVPLAVDRKVPVVAVGMAMVAGTWEVHNLAAQDSLASREGQVEVLVVR